MCELYKKAGLDLTPWSEKCKKNPKKIVQHFYDFPNRLAKKRIFTNRTLQGRDELTIAGSDN